MEERDLDLIQKRVLITLGVCFGSLVLFLINKFVWVPIMDMGVVLGQIMGTMNTVGVVLAVYVVKFAVGSFIDWISGN